MKLLLDEAKARLVEERLRTVLEADPHSGKDGYHITTLYCDTAGLDVFHRVGRYRLCKFRLRQYGDGDELFLERKSKRGVVVRKRRETMSIAQVRGFGWRSLHENWRGAAYQRQIVRNRVAPVCLIEYDRVAWLGDSSEGPLRLTFDRRIQGALRSEWSLAPHPSMHKLLSGSVVCEFKFRGSLPQPFKAVIEALKLAPCGVSKYLHCMQTAGVRDHA